MLKFIKNHITSIDNIEIYPMISLVIFVLFFVGLLIYVLKTDKQKIEEISQYPLK